jgi:predicted nucleic acid-binding protein
MRNAAFFDTNVLVYMYDRQSPRKQQIAREVYREHFHARTIVLSTQILQEFFVTLTKKIPGTPLELARSLTSDFAQLNVVAVQPRDVLDAIDLQARHKLSFWDSLVLTTARVAHASVLFTEDLIHGRVYEGVRVQNPFLVH